MRMMLRYRLALLICGVLPPIVSQKVRNFLISIEEAEKLNFSFRKRIFTGSYFEGNTSDFHAFKLSVHGYFDWRNVILARESLKKNPGIVVEGGANIGTETISYCDVAKKMNTYVVAFEPVPSNIDLILHNQRLNKIDNLELYTCLVAEKKGKAFFNFPSGNNSGSGYIEKNVNNRGAQEYDVVTLDETIKNRVVSFISVDVEGFEYQVLRGAKNILYNCRPLLVVEVNQKLLKERGESSVEQVYNFLKTLNYKCYYINSFNLKEVEIDYILNKKNKNWLCVPANKGFDVSRLNRSLRSGLLMLR
jgi:FkbM family methyltransferase